MHWHVMIYSKVHAASRAFTQARMSPTFHAVTRFESFIGLGKLPSFTSRHKVGELNGKGAVSFDLEAL